MDDKRKFERFAVHAPAKMEILRPGEAGGKIPVEARNLSAGGIFIQTANLLPEGSPVKMEIYLQFSEAETQPDHNHAKVIVVSGRIVRSTDEGTAICFNDDYDIISTKDF